MNNHEFERNVKFRGELTDFIVRCKKCRVMDVAFWINNEGKSFTPQSIEKLWKKYESLVKYSERVIQKYGDCNELVTRNVLNE